MAIAMPNCQSLGYFFFQKAHPSSKKSIIIIISGSLVA
jgi:hypothetical protein